MKGGGASAAHHLVVGDSICMQGAGASASHHLVAGDSVSTRGPWRRERKHLQGAFPGLPGFQLLSGGRWGRAFLRVSAGLALANHRRRRLLRKHLPFPLGDGGRRGRGGRRQALLLVVGCGYGVDAGARHRGGSVEHTRGVGRGDWDEKNVSEEQKHVLPFMN